MGPKKAKKEQVPPAPNPAASGLDESENAEYLKQVSDAVAVVKNKWPDIMSAAALGLDPVKCGAHSIAGHQPPLTAADYKTAMTNSGEAAGGMNLFAIDILKSSTPGVPINTAGVRSLTAQRFAEPKRCSGKAQIARIRCNRN
jgi:hypothetical protein